jgi:hypothetical protein
MKGHKMDIEIYHVAKAKKLLKEKGSKVCIDISGDGTWCYLEKSDWISMVGTGKYFVNYDGHLTSVGWTTSTNHNSVMYVYNYTHTSDDVDPDELQDLNLG